MISLTKTLAIASLTLAVACGGGPSGQSSDAGVFDAGPPIDATPPPPTFEECADTDHAFVRSAHLAVLGHRPKSSAVTNVYADLMEATRLRNVTAQAEIDPRRVVVFAMSQEAAFTDRWSEQLMDMLLVPRIEDQSQQSCYGDRARVDDSGELAAYIQTTEPTAGGDGNGDFTMLDLVRSSLALDDVSPIYRAHLFALVSRPIPAANVPPVQAELARREDFGNVFDAAYLGREITCLGCHNSTNSITYREDPATNRHWDIPGRFEEAIYGVANGIAPERAHAPFRFDGFVAGNFRGAPGDTIPWGWDRSCGEFQRAGLSSDPAGIDGRFASLSGQRITAFDLEESLSRGIASITANGLVLDDSEGIADADAAFAYLVATNIVDSTWAEVMGSRLTIANHFPRNRASRDLLQSLTESFVASSFSMRTLLAEIVSTPYFARLPAEAGCGVGPYNMPAVFDPWTTEDAELERRNNGPGDGVHPLAARTLLSSAYVALQWRRPFFESFPERPFSVDSCAQALPSCEQLGEACANNGQCCFAERYWCDYVPSNEEPSTREQRSLMRGIGVFLKNGDKGFRGLDFQARLVFEDRFGDCRKTDDAPDFLDALVSRARASDTATLGDVLAATKDRLVSNPTVHTEPGPANVSEAEALESLFGASLTTPAGGIDELDTRLRVFCGSLLASPQFLLSGMPNSAANQPPALTPAELSYESQCEALKLPEGLSEHTLVCGAESLTLE